MDFNDISDRAVAIQERYREYNVRKGHAAWTTAEYLQGFVGDVGDLSKLVMASNGYRAANDMDRQVGHELADCLWSIIVIARETGVDLEREFLATMDALEARLGKSLND